MKLGNRIISTVALLLLSALSARLADGQSLASKEGAVGMTAVADGMSGVVVEKVVKNSEGERAELQEGDALLHWSRGDSKGEIESPFDVSLVEVEQAPRGPVTLQGLRGTEKRVWALGPSAWNLKTKPNFAPDVLSFYQEGENLAKVGKPTEAAERWRLAAEKLRGSHSAWVHAWLLLHTAEAFSDARQWKEADDTYHEAIQQAAEAGPWVKAQLFQAWADVFRQRGDWANAEKHYQEAAEESKKLSSDTLIFADALDGIGTAAFRRGDPTRAEQSFSEAAEIQKKLAPGSLNLARSLNGLGVVAWAHGDPDKAEEYYHQSLAIREKLSPGSLDVAASLNNLGVVARERGDLTSAEEYQHQSLTIKENLAPGSLDVAASLNNLAVVARERGDLASAEEYNRQALAIREKLAPDGLDVASSLGNLGNVAWSRGDLAKAEEYYHQALAIEEKLSPDGRDTAQSFNNLGVVAQDRKDLTGADEYLRRALVLKQKLEPDSIDVAYSLSDLGDLARERGDLSKAEEYNRQALAIREKLAPGGLDAAESLNNLGDVARDRGDLSKAQEYYRKAVAIREKLSPGSKDHAETLASLAEIMMRTGQPEAAAPLFEQALTALESQMTRLGGGEETRSRFRALHADYYCDYIDLLVRQKQPELAFQVLERSRARTFLEMLAATHIDVHKGVDPALIERQRSLGADITAKTNRRIQLMSTEHTDGQIAAIKQEIDKLLAQNKDVEEQIRVSSPSYAALTQPQPLNAKQVQQLLDEDTLLLEYTLGEDRSYVFAVTTNSLNAHELPKRIEIENAARQVRDLLAARNRYDSNESGVSRQARLDKSDAEYVRAAAALSQMVLGPAAQQLQQKRLLIVADGALQYISFAALPMSNQFSPPATAGAVASAALSSEHGTAAPLVVEHEIVNLPAASVLAVLRREAMERKPAPKAVAVLADPVFAGDDARVRLTAKTQKSADEITHGAGGETEAKKDDANGTYASQVEHLTRSASDVGLSSGREGVYLPRLPFSRREATAILSVIPASQGMKALDFQASRATATGPDLAQYRVVHFATHGLLDNEHPELSGLVFSLVDRHGKPQNGFVDLQDIYNLNLSADLVVLSACETGLGKEVRGEGLVGLTRGFMYAGASRVVASLWSVDDVATAELMQHFYEAMEQQGMRPAAALRQAQVAMLKQGRWSNPYYWAGFVIQGEWK